MDKDDEVVVYVCVAWLHAHACYGLRFYILCELPNIKYKKFVIKSYHITIHSFIPH